MGQAWCKERTTKAQDSKSPLDRVFVRCAHQIYPTLKQDGSVLGGATQRVTSSEIGYAGSPPREALTRGESVDSIDRPFHPSDWVDVNLEVPSTPSSVITNLTANTSLYQTTTLSSTASNMKNNITPIPPPRRRRKNRGRPLPPKPDEATETHGNGKPANKIEPLYSSVKSPKIRDRELREANEKAKKNDDADKEDKSNEHKVTERISAIKKVTEGDRWTTGDPGDVKEENAHQKEVQEDRKNPNKNKNKNKKVEEEDEEKKSNNQELEYEKFSQNRGLRNSSTPNGPGKNSERESSLGKDLREFVSRTIMDDDDILNVVHHRPKNYSTVSLPNYDELEVVKKEVEREAEEGESDPAPSKKPQRGRNISTISLPPAELLASLPEGSTDRLEKYMTRCRSFGSLQPHEILDKLKAHGEQVDSSDDEWAGIDDWDLGVPDGYQPSDGRSPLEPNSRLRERKKNIVPIFKIGGEDVVATKNEELTFDATNEPHSFDKDRKTCQNGDIELSESDAKTLSIPRNASFEVPKSPNSLKSALKAEANRKISMPAKLSSPKPGNSLEEWFSAQERSVRFFDVPKLEEEYANTPGHLPAKPSDVKKTEVEYDTRSYPFNGLPTGPIDIDNFFNTTPISGDKKDSGDSPGRQERARNLTRSLSNESEPFDAYEEKELTLDIRSQPSSIGKLSRTISDESIPAEMNDPDDSPSENTTGDEKTKSNDSKTPPPSPEPKIFAEILENDHFSAVRPTSLKIQKDDEGESNLSSMTPSLTELEAALSDMLEKEDQDEPRADYNNVENSEDSNLRHSEKNQSLDQPIEPKIVPNKTEREVSKNKGKDLDREENSNLLVRRRKENVKINLSQILNDDGKILENFDEKLQERVKENKIVGKNPFEDTDDEKDDANEPGTGFDDISKTTFNGSKIVNPFDGEPPEKPNRLHKIPIDQDSSETIPDIPTPPQRKNKHGAISPTTKSPANNMDSEFPIRDSTPHPNDRLI